MPMTTIVDPSPSVKISLAGPKVTDQFACLTCSGYGYTGGTTVKVGISSTVLEAVRCTACKGVGNKM